MPKLNFMDRLERLQVRIEQLKRGEEVDKKDINALLTAEQQKLIAIAWQRQQDLRKTHKPPKTDELAKLIGWKTIRQVRMEVLQLAFDEIADNMGMHMQAMKHEQEVKAARVFMDTYFKAKDEKKNAWSVANNALRTHGLPRIDGADERRGTARDREVRKMEEDLLKRFESELTDAEREQMQLSKQHDESVKKRE